MTVDPSSPLVLIVASDRSSGLILIKRLESFGFRTDLVSNELGVMEYIKSAAYVPDLILVNLSREDSPLLNLPKQLKEESPWGNHVPCAAYSALNDRTFIVKVLTRGFADYILRPVELDLFRDHVYKLTKRSVKLSPETYRRPMNEVAHLQLAAQLIQINEFGLVVTAPDPIPVGMIFTLTCPSLNLIFGGSVRVRTVANRNLTAGESETTLVFVALEPSQARQLRKFAMTATVSSKVS